MGTGGRRRAVAGLVLAGVLALGGPPAAHAAFPQDPPNDPEYAAAERDCLSTAVSSEQYYLYAGTSRCTPRARPPGGAAGMSIDAAWARHTAGRPDVTIAYVEGGINWHQPASRDLADQVFLNRGELPAPTTPVDDGRLDVRDYADTPDANHNGFVDPEDLIARFSDGRDDDHNGYTDDISGWDFYDHQNDPATYDATYDHANNQQRRAAAEADNGLLGAGICPRCTILPVKAGAEALDREDDLAQAWEYAADVGASVVVSVTADLGYSTFMRQVVDDLWRRGVVMVEASNDFDSTDHQGGMFHPHVVGGNGMVADSAGIPGGAANALTTSFTERSGLTSFGTKDFLTVSTEGGSTSESTPTHGGVYALLVAAGRQAADEHRLTSPLTGAEVLQVARATATDIDDPAGNWPSRPGFDLQFGYGRPDVLRAMDAIFAGDIPPVGWIDAPDWYALYDPTRTPVVRVRGHVAAPRSRGYRWQLQMAPGAQPADADWMDAGSGGGSRPFTGTLGRLDLRRLPSSFWRKAYSLSKGKTLETSEAYTVTLRLRVTDASGRVGEDRRTIAVQHDPTALPGFPQRLRASATAQPQLVDLQGRGTLAAVFGDGDGAVHAIDMVSGDELPGWPRHTDRVRVVRAHRGIDPGHEPVIAQAAVGDLDASGRLSVVVTSSSGRTYVWDARGRRRPGWPKRLATGVTPPPVPRPALRFTRLPVQGATAPPVLADLDGDGRLDVVQAAWDGHVHAWHADGRAVRGFPVAPRIAAPPPDGYSRLDDRKLDTPPALADLDGDGRPELVLRTQQMDIRDGGIQPLAWQWSVALHHDGTPVAGWPVRTQNLFAYYGSAQEFVTEGASVPTAADVDGDGRDEVEISPLFSPGTLYRGDGTPRAVYGPVPDAVRTLLGDPTRLLEGQLPTDAPLSFSASGAFGRVGGSGGLTYTEPGSNGLSIVGALLLAGTGRPIVNVERAYDARTGAGRPGFPAVSQGLNFLGGQTIADVTGDGRAEVLEGADSSALHAFEAPGGGQANGFPKFTTGWTVYAPAVGDVGGDGRVEVVAVTREGYLMAWRTPGRASADGEWWSYRHDERNTSRYGEDTRPPGPVGRLRLRSGRAAFDAPGDDWLSGTPRRYVVRAYRRGRRSPSSVREVAATHAAGFRESVAVPRRAVRVSVQAADEAGNLGTPVSARARR